MHVKYHYSALRHVRGSAPAQTDPDHKLASALCLWLVKPKASWVQLCKGPRPCARECVCEASLLQVM